MNHDCAKMRLASTGPHKVYRDVIMSIEWHPDTRAWYAHSGEYADRINFCPWCGARLVKMEAEAPAEEAL